VLRNYSDQSNLVKQANGTYVAFVHSPEAANVINARLRYYPTMPDFVSEGSEARFVLREVDRPFVEAVMARFNLLG